MAISDLSREPALERALPADAAPGPTIPENTEAKVQLNDGTWTWAQVIGQRTLVRRIALVRKPIHWRPRGMV
jgi:hypothetical protein